MKATKVSIDNRTIIRVLLITLAFFIGLQVVVKAADPLIWIASSVFLAIGLNPAVSWFAKFMPRKSRVLATAIVFTGFLLVLGFLVFEFIPPLIKQTEALTNSIPQAIHDVQNPTTDIGRLANKLHVSNVLANLQDQLTSWLSHAAGSAVGIAGSVFGGLAATITILTLTIFMMIEGPAWMKRLWAVWPAATRKRDQELAHEMYTAVTGYVNGNLVTSAIAGVTSAIILSILHVPFAIPLGVMVAILDLIPLVGATLAAVIVIIVSLFVSSTAAIIMLVFFILYQQIENNLLQPLIYGRSTELSPLLVTSVILVGAALGGLFGALVAIPIAASIKVLVVFFSRNRIEANDIP